MTSKREAKLALFALINILDRTSSFDGPDSKTIALRIAAYGSGLPFQGDIEFLKICCGLFKSMMLICLSAHPTTNNFWDESMQ